jgi:hypothetical protein
MHENHNSNNIADHIIATQFVTITLVSTEDVGLFGSLYAKFGSYKVLFDVNLKQTMLGGINVVLLQP